MNTPEGLERAMQKVELHRLLVLLVNEGVLGQQPAAGYFAELAEFTRTLDLPPALRPYADQKATHYEDVANLMLGGGLLPRDPTT